MFIYILKRCLPLGVTLHPKQYSRGDNQKIKKWDKIERRRMSPSVWTHNGRWNMPDEGRTRQHTHTHNESLVRFVSFRQRFIHGDNGTQHYSILENRLYWITTTNGMNLSYDSGTTSHIRLVLIGSIIHDAYIVAIGEH